MNRIATIISALFSPLFIPTYGVGLALLTTTLYYVAPSAKWHVLLTTLAITGVIPLIAIYVLTRIGKVKDAGLNERRERTIPYLISLACYLGCAGYLVTVHSPSWLTMFIVGGAAALTVATTVNFWWKISGHAAGMGGLVALMIHITARSLNVWDTQWIAMAAIVLAGAVCTSRLILRRHTIGQLAAGFTLGFLSVFIATDFNY